MMQRRQRFWISFAALMSLPCTVAAQMPAADRLPCLTPGEGQAILAFTLPDIVAGLSRKCGPALGSTSYMSQSGLNLAERYRPQSNAAWSQARPALRKLAGETAVFADMMSDEVFKGVASGVATTAVLKEVQPAQCRDIDRILRAVAPLPPENMSMLVGILLEIASRPTAQAAVAKAKSPFNICPAPSGAGQMVTTK
ncbi:MAG: hypothetical protein ACKOXK_03465 [Chakrabartia sp.]